MKTKRIAQLCCAALVAAGIGLNIQNALADYGIGESSLSLVAKPGSGTNSNPHSNTNGTGTLSRNFKSRDVWFRSSSSAIIDIKLKNPGFSFGTSWNHIKCCLQGTDMDGCDFSLENSDCKRVVDRPAH